MRVIVPYLRGYGPTRFLDDATPRSGQQAAAGQDILDLLDALAIDHAVLAGFDWGDRAACIVAVLHPERVAGRVGLVGLVTSGYSIQDIAHGSEPKAPALERADWYQHCFQHKIGRRALIERRDELIEFLWRTWSPTWTGATDPYPVSASSFSTPDFVDVVVHSYGARRVMARGVLSVTREPSIWLNVAAAGKGFKPSLIGRTGSPIRHTSVSKIRDDLAEVS